MQLDDDQRLEIAAKNGDPVAQARLGIARFTQGRAADALPWLERAAEAGVQDAENLLGLMYLNGIEVAQRPVTAVEYLKRAADAGLKEACYTLANLLFSGIGAETDTRMALEYLLTSARLMHPPALRTLGMLASLPGATSAVREASLDWLATAAQLGDALSQYSLAMRYLEREGVTTQELQTGLYWLTTSAERKVWCAGTRLGQWRGRIGLGEASRLLQGFRPAPVTNLNLEAASQFDLPTPGANLVPQELVPGVLFQCPDVLPAAICEHLMNAAAPGLAPSRVVDPETGQPSQNSVRTSSSMYFRLSMYDFVTGYAVKQLAAVAGQPAVNAEPVSLLRYLPGQEYKPHYDYFAGAGNREEFVQDRGGQRVTTVFVYLTDVAAGGETDFPLLGARVSASRGKAVKFLNCLPDGAPDKRTLHAGMPVREGEKWLATLWFRERPFVWGDLTRH